MLIKQENFRNYLGKFIVIKSKEDAENQERFLNIGSLSVDKIEDKFHTIPVRNNVDSMLVYPYIDHQVGTSFLLLATSLMDDNGGIRIYHREKFNTFQTIRKEAVNDKEFFYLDDLTVNEEFDLKYYQDYASERTSVYKSDEIVEKLRSFTLIDEFRNEDYPDDILVFFFKDGLTSEGMWVRCEKLENRHIIATLLNQPNQNFGINCGDKVKVRIITKGKSGKTMCIADL